MALESAPVDAVWMFTMGAIIDKTRLVAQFDKDEVRNRYDSGSTAHRGGNVVSPTGARQNS